MEKELREFENNELLIRLLTGSEDLYGVYQLKKTPELDEFRFEGTESLKRMGITKYNFSTVVPENYDLLYVGNLSELQRQSCSETLEAIYEKFNIARPDNFKGHSLSVSDIVVLHQNGRNSAHFVDSFGFTGFPDFAKALEGMAFSKDNIRENVTDIIRTANKRGR